MSIVFYANGDSQNHGCEAITRSLVKIMGGDEGMSFATINAAADSRYQLDSVCNLFPLAKSATDRKIAYVIYWLKQHIKASDVNYYKLVYRDFVDSVKSGNLYVSIGGDNYSYGKSDWLSYLNKSINYRGAKTVLLGCSILDEITERELREDLSRYKLIVARESLTYEALRKSNIPADIMLLPDPAFQLNRIDGPLPAGWQSGNMVGVNISPMVMGLDGGAQIAMRNYEKLLEYIIKETDMSVALIPHVVWSHNDDRQPLKYLYDKYVDSGRVVMVEDCGAEVLKGYIARCRFMVAARTHASIAAYSTGVPTLVVGYSVKARGIALDLFGDSVGYVVPVQSLKSEQELAAAFRWLMARENDIRDRLRSIMPDYIRKALELKSVVENII